MEFGVLESGLKNKRIFNIQTFLMIQSEGFKIRLQQCIEQNNENNFEFLKLFDEWDEIFNKIIHVLRNVLNRITSTEEELNFGFILASVTLKIINKLFKTFSYLDDYEKNIKFIDLNNRRKLFTENRLNDNETIFQLVNDEYANQKEKNEIYIENELYSKKNLIEPMKIQNNWTEKNFLSFKELIKNIKNNKIQNCENLLKEISLPFNETIKYIFLNSYDFTILENLFNYFQKKKLFPEIIRKINSLKIIEKVYKINTPLSLSCLNNFDNLELKNILLVSLFENSFDINQNIDIYKLLKKEDIWFFLTICNDKKSLINLLENNLLPNISFKLPHLLKDINITNEMLKITEKHGQGYLKEKLFDKLSQKLIFNSVENENINFLLKRLYFSLETKCLLCKSGFLNMKMNITKNQKLIEYSIENECFDFLYWYLLQEQNFKLFKSLKNIDVFLKMFFIAIIDYKNDPSNQVKTLNLILQSCRYLTRNSEIQSINDLIENNFKLEAICCIFLSPTIINDSSLNKSQIWYMDKKITLNFLKKNYPILNNSYIEVLEEHSINENLGYSKEIPSLYELLKNTTNFDIKMLFDWQNANEFRIPKDNCVDLPHFSQSELSKQFGLKANLNYLYYLIKGRPMDAFNYYQENMLLDDTCKNLENVINSSTLLSFYNCLNDSIVSAIIIFYELLDVNSSEMRLLLAAARLIMNYAADFLSFHPENQINEIGKLLEQACLSKSKPSQTKLLELIITSFDRKYPDAQKLTNECVEYDLAITFARKYDLDLPLSFIYKCMKNDDWLMLTVYIQLYEYPKSTFIHLFSNKEIRTFSNGCIGDHLEKAFQSDALVISKKFDFSKKEKSEKILSRTRNHLYRRIFLNKMPSSLKQTQASPNSDILSESISGLMTTETENNFETSTMLSSSIISEYFEGIEYDEYYNPRSLFNLLISCQKANVIEPWKLLYVSVYFKNPILSLIAASLFHNDFENDFYYVCFASWLSNSFSIFTQQNGHEQLNTNWDENSFDNLLKSGLENPKNLYLFKTGLILFSQENEHNPLIELIDFFYEFLIEKNYHESIYKLLDYIKLKNNYQENLNADFPLHRADWIERISIILIETSLCSTCCLHEFHLMLQHLSLCGIYHLIKEPSKIVNIPQLNQLIQCVIHTKIEINLKEIFYAIKNNNSNKIVLINIVENLQKEGYFLEAREFAKYGGCFLDDVIINELTIKAFDKNDEISFWIECIESLNKNNVSYEKKCEFVSKVINLIRFDCFEVLLTLICLLKNGEFLININDEKIKKLQLNFWKGFIRLEKNKSNYTNKKEDECVLFIWNLLLKYGLNSEIDYQEYNYEKIINQSNEKIETSDLQIFINILNCILNKGCNRVAHAAAFLFNLDHESLKIIKLCENIVECKNISELKNIVVSESLIKKNENLEFRNLVLNELNELYNQVEIGKKSVQSIILAYKISCALNCSYLQIKEEDNKLILLNKLLQISNKNPEVVHLIRELIALNNISDNEIVNLVCRDIEQYLNIECDNDLQFEESLNSKPKVNKLLVIIRLLSEPRILGKRILQIMGRIDNLTNSLNKTVELCIKAHECFTLSSDIEGIATILQKVRLLVNKHIVPLKDYRLLIRLLTGIGRYSEMAYVFDILKENHQFELLLSKKIIKNSQLRIALIDFLKNDKEIFQMIALNFSMHREIAELLETQSLHTLRNLRFNSSNSISYRSLLEDLMQDLIDASESYTKAGCYNKSTKCEKLAQLIALQINYLPSMIIVVNMTESQVINFIIFHKKFFESHIVADAYNCHHNWSSALFHNIILAGDWQYYRDYTTYYKLNTLNFEEILNMYNKFKKEKDKSYTNDMLYSIKQNVQKLVSLMKDLKAMYKYAMEHSLISISPSLAECSNVGYIKDLRRQNKI